MTEELYHYRFIPTVDMEQVIDFIVDAILISEDLHGAARTRLDCAYQADEIAGTVTIDACTEAGQTMAAVFTGLLLRHLAEDAFSVLRIDPGSDAAEIQCQTAASAD